MLVQEIIPEEETIRDAASLNPLEGDRTHSHRGMMRYVVTVSGVMALLYLAPLFLVRSRLYDRVNPSFYAKALNYPFETAGENADVVLFGDSTALLGIDPSQMSAALGVKVLNLVNTQPSLVVNDDMSLRHYLKANRPPRLIVFYFAPWDFDYGHNNFNSRPTYDGEELLLRHGTSEEIRAFVLKHPKELLLFPLKFYATFWQYALLREFYPNEEAQLKATRGHVDLASSSILKAPCKFPQYLIDNVRFSWVHDLGERYRSPETKVLFYVAPVPACENGLALVNRPYDQLPAAPPRQVAPEFFMDDVRFIHPHPSAVPELTRNLTDAVRPVLASAP